MFRYKWSHRDRKQIGGCEGLEVGGEWLFNVYGISFEEMKISWNYTEVMAAQHYECSKCYWTANFKRADVNFMLYKHYYNFFLKKPPLYFLTPFSPNSTPHPSKESLLETWYYFSFVFFYYSSGIDVQVWETFVLSHQKTKSKALAVRPSTKKKPYAKRTVGPTKEGRMVVSNTTAALIKNTTDTSFHQFPASVSPF